MFKKVLIANRGEIAVRIIRACRELGIATVAVYSEADRQALHVKLADEAYCVGPAPTKDSYLHISRILLVAAYTKADAVHPGYGFLAENAEFAEACIEAGLTFIGPSPSAMRQMGDKATARQTMQQVGVPIIPGTEGLVDDLATAKSIADQIGYPVLVKATAGGGGKGMRIVRQQEELEQAIQLAQKEVASLFGDSGVYLEKYLEDPRHIEMQIMADKFGHIVYLGERDCSLQRRHQKLLEEAPSAAIDESLRLKMGQAAVNAACAVQYEGAGTVEFLLDRDGNFYFIEMNTRIQVEHGITELVTGIDLIKEQIAVAGGSPLSFVQEDIKISGWAIECRINAEDPAENFRPCPGKVEKYLPPGGFGVRVDSSVYSGCIISPFYDSLVAKVLVWGKTRQEAIARMKRALAEFVIEGIDTTIPFHQQILDNEQFIKGQITTGFLS